MTVDMTKRERLYVVTLWTGESRDVWALDGPSAAAAALTLTDPDPVTGYGHRVGWDGTGSWEVTYSDAEGTSAVATVEPCDWNERTAPGQRPPFKDGTARALDDDARDLAQVGDDYAAATLRADRDVRRMLVLFGVVAVGVAGYLVGDHYGQAQACDPSAPGCQFVADGMAYLTLDDGIAWPQCPSEDAAGPCVWDATTRGNGQGTSFLVLADGTVVPY